MFGSLLAVLAVSSLQAPATSTVRPADSADLTPRASHFGLHLGIANAGVSLGNSAVWTGARLNLRDHDLRTINGVAVSLWKAKFGANRKGTVTGVAFGVVAPEAGRLRGLALGGVGVVANHDVIGISAAGGVVFSERSIRGLGVAGFGPVALGRITGAAIGGLGVFAKGGIDGLSIAPLAVVSGGEVRGVTVGGLGVAGNAGIHGATIGGLGVVARGRLAGLTVASLAVVGGADVLGITAAGLAISAKGRVGGINLAGLVVQSAESVEGITATLYRVQAPRLVGFSLASYHRIQGEQRGLVIGIINSARELHGFQFGLLNHAGNNAAGLRWLPILNFHR